MASPPALAKLRRELTKLWLKFRWPIIGGSAALLLAIGGYFGYSQNLEDTQQANQVQSAQIASQVAGTLSGVIAEQKEILDGFDYSALAELLATNKTQAIEEFSTATTTKHPTVLGLRLLKDPVEQIDDDGMPPVTFAALGMAKSAAESGEPPPVEFLLSGTKQKHIAVLRPLKDSADQVIGHVLFALDPKVLTRVITAQKIAPGYLEVTQQGSKKGKPVAFSGDTGSRQGVAQANQKVPGSLLRILVWPQADAPALASAEEGLPVLEIAVALVALILALAGAWYFKKRRGKSPGADKVSDTAENAVVLNSKLAALKSDGSGDVPGDGELEDEGDPGLEATDADGAPPAAAMKLDSSIFRAYDVRGIVSKNLGADVVRKLGLAIGSEAYDRGQQTLVVGCDGRLSSPELLEALIEGLRESGRDVIEIGRVPTPVLYFATHYLETGSGVVVTGSHNPSDYNGLKIMLGNETLFGDSIQALKQRILDNEFSSGAGTLQTMEISTDYIRRVSEDVPVALGNAFKVVIDCGNGIAGEFAPKLIRALGHDVVELFCEVDGNFPNHHPDPSQPENLADLIQMVKEQDADLGFAFDGDGDRLGVVDSNGEIIWPDIQMMLYARDVLSRNPGAEIVYDVKCTSRLGKVISKLGGKPVMYKTGHSYIKNKLKETGAPLAGEMSGHIFFGERWYGFDDAMYSAARLLEILMNFKQRPAEVFAKLPQGVNTPELQVQVKEGENHALIEKLVANNPFTDAKIITIDGLRVEWPDGWGLARASNTTPSIVLRFEGDNQQALDRIKESFRGALQGLSADMDLPF